MDPVTNFAQAYRYIEKNYQNPHCLNDFEKGSWHPVSTQTFVDDVRALTLALAQIGLKRGERVGILALPSAKWSIVNWAISFAGGVVVPLFANIAEENFVFECMQAEVKTLFVCGEAQWQMYERNKALFDRVIDLDGCGEGPNRFLYTDLLEQGRDLQTKEPQKFDELLNKINSQDTAAIIYTSGSTGVPKGAELTQLNLCVSLHDTKGAWTPESVRYLNILPLAHIYGYIVNMIALYWGANIYYVNDVKQLVESCKQVHPTTLIIVPRVAEKLYAKFVQTIWESSWIKRAIGLWAIHYAKKPYLLSKKGLLFRIADRLVYKKLREALGGNLSVVVSGGAPLDINLQYFFANAGIEIFQGWGLTEACPATCNNRDANKFGTVGTPYVNDQIKISPEGEILLKGQLLMKGYYKNPEATAEVIDKDGWFHTGDKGKIDEDGYLTIIGRLKELYKTSTGEYVAPTPIEQALATHPLIDMAMAVAEGRKFVAALFFPNRDQVALFKTQYGQTNLSDEEFLNSWAVQKEMEKHLNKINEHLNHWEQVHDYRFIMEAPSVENGDLTPSMKIRREALAKKYSALIDEIYQHMELS